MAVHYNCRHCKAHIGTIQPADVSAEQLGFHALSDDEHKEMVSYTSDGDIHVKITCEDCQDALQTNPDYHALSHFIQ
ncbi:anti-sigma-F factor Fin [Fictibacillus iocasae]|uniref:Anti-sigma-F factor Fin n=1 Tax=Fictibacillus iocasae TaxID=2715437 RepID=A0ABW2NRW6_9BACL